MKVLYGTYPWAFDTPGGGERQLLAYKNHLAKLNIHVDLFDAWCPKFTEYDVFHFFSVQPGSIHFCNYIKEKGLKLVISPNLWITHESKTHYPYKEIWNIYEIADRIVVNSDMEGNQMSDVFSMPRDKFVTVYNGVEDEFLVETDSNIFRTRYGLKKPYILNVANIESRKNQAKFLEALRSFPEYDFVVVGHVRNQEYLDECLKEGAGRFKLIEPIEYNSSLLRSAIVNCEFFAMPSLLETPSIAALEAACMGKKILITEGGSTREYFGGSVIYLNPNSTESMAEGILKVREWTHEHSQWRVQNSFMWSKCIHALNDCYSEILAK